jgi:hypothetical protein
MEDLSRLKEVEEARIRIAASFVGINWIRTKLFSWIIHSHQKLFP